MEPAWVGIGAQRSGTTWFCDVLCQHPQISLGGDYDRWGELHYFDRFLWDEFTDSAEAEYRRLFGEGQGEWTPGYLRWPWVAPLLRKAAPNALLIVLLRDPVERCISALRWYLRSGVKNEQIVWNLFGSDATWGGMYATQLRLWHRHFPTIHVEQYERAVADPELAASKVWRRLRLEPVEVGDVSAPSETSTDGIDRWPQLRPQLRSLYQAEVRQVEEHWGIDSGLWRG